MRSTLIFLLIFLVSIKLIGQTDFFGTVAKEKDKSERLYRRTLVSPRIMPLQHIYLSLLDKEGNDIPWTQDFGYDIGLEFMRYQPNGKYNFSLGVDYNKQRGTILKEEPLLWSSSSVGLTPSFDFKKRDLERSTTPFFTLGWSSQLSISRQLKILSPVGTASSLGKDELASLRSWLVVGVGLNKVVFNHDLSDRKKIVPIQSMRLNVFLPLFDQTNIFKNYAYDFRAALASFERSRFRTIPIRVHYSQYLDFEENNNKNSIPIEYAPPRKDRFLGPLFNLNLPRYRVHGAFFMQAINAPKRDSVIVKMEETAVIISLAGSNGWQLGYTLHLGNDHKSVFENTGNKVYGQDFRFSVFAGGGLRSMSWDTEGGIGLRLQRLSVIGQGGVRFAYKGVGLHVGGGIQSPVSERGITNTLDTEQFNFEGQDNIYLFFGACLRDAITLRIIREKLPSAKLENMPNDNYYSLVFGWGI